MVRRSRHDCPPLGNAGTARGFCASRVRLVRGRFGSYEPIDFLGLLVGYAISGERTLADFFERVAPFEEAFMALFGRRSLPHRSSLSRFLADVDRPCLEAFRALFEQYTFAEGWTVLSLDMVDNSINLYKHPSGWFPRHWTVWTGHLILE